jgi:putative transposase
MARCQPDLLNPPAHDTFTRFLHRLQPDPNTLWTEAQTQVQKDQGILVIDDSTLDKPYARHMPLVTQQWSGKHHAVVQGINLVILIWTDGDRAVPCDYAIFDKSDKLTKNDHFAAMVKTAHQRGFRPKCVAFDGWYSSLANLKLLRSLSWNWLTRLKSNRVVNKNREGPKHLKDVEISEYGTEVWLKGYGLVKVFKIVAPNGDVSYWATNNLQMTELERLQLAEFSWQIEHYHRGIKQCTGIEGCQCRRSKAQRNHIGLALRAFLRLESYSYHEGVSWFEAKWRLIPDAIRSYFHPPTIRLFQSATA